MTLREKNIIQDKVWNHIPEGSRRSLEETISEREMGSRWIDRQVSCSLVPWTPLNTVNRRTGCDTLGVAVAGIPKSATQTQEQKVMPLVGGNARSPEKWEMEKVGAIFRFGFYIIENKPFEYYERKRSCGLLNQPYITIYTQG